MDFYIKKNSTLPILSIEVFIDDDVSFRNTSDSFSSSTITFDMRDESSGLYRIINKSVTVVDRYSTGDSPLKSYYLQTQFTEKETKKIGSFIGEFKITNSDGVNILPISENIVINIIDSFSEPDLCCRPNRGEPKIQFPSETPRSTPSTTPSTSPSNSVTPSNTPSISVTPSITQSLGSSPTPSTTPSPSTSSGDKTIYVYYPNL